MIWEVDYDLDGCVSWEEFKGCYVRTLQDSHGLELNQLYYLIQFLLCDTDGSQTVSGKIALKLFLFIAAADQLLCGHLDLAN